MPISRETATEMTSPVSPYRSSPLSPNIMISTMLRSPINSPYRQSPFLRPTPYASPPAQPPSVLSPDSNERYYYSSPSGVRNVSLKNSFCSVFLALEVKFSQCVFVCVVGCLAGVEEIVCEAINTKWFVKLNILNM